MHIKLACLLLNKHVSSLPPPEITNMLSEYTVQRINLSSKCAIYRFMYLKRFGTPKRPNSEAILWLISHC